MIKDSGERTEFSTGAVRDMKKGKGRMDLLPWYGIMEVSKHCEEGAEKYGEHNVDKGIPLHSLLDSASRHLAKVMCGETDEDHLRAAAWNILWALNQRTTHPELNDLYFEKKEYKKCEAWIKLSYDDLKDYVGKEVAVDLMDETSTATAEVAFEGETAGHAFTITLIFDVDEIMAKATVSKWIEGGNTIIEIE